jgi:ribosomal protein S18 acetylase RimI-like enzyme
MAERIAEGITSAQINELVLYSLNDPFVATFTSDRNRFQNIQSFENWSKQGRSIYVLTNENEALLGVIWFGEKGIPASGLSSYGITFAIRLYGEARGKGLAVKFMEEAFERYRETENYYMAENKGIWLEVSSNNIAAIKAYEKFGFQKIMDSEQEKILMILPENVEFGEE